MQHIQRTPVAGGIRHAFLKAPTSDTPAPAPEPLTDDLPDSSATCGWFGSSLELRQGLEVVELRETGPRRHPVVAPAAAGPRWPPGAPALP